MGRFQSESRFLTCPHTHAQHKSPWRPRTSQCLQVLMRPPIHHCTQCRVSTWSVPGSLKRSTPRLHLPPPSVRLHRCSCGGEQDGRNITGDRRRGEQLTLCSGALQCANQDSRPRRPCWVMASSVAMVLLLMSSFSSLSSKFFVVLELVDSQSLPPLLLLPCCVMRRRVETGHPLPAT